MAATINRNFQQLTENYLFAEVAGRIRAWQERHPDRHLVRLGIGDVTRPLPQIVVAAMQKAAGDLAAAETFHGYGPEQGHIFLREAVRSYYQKFGVTLDIDEIFISDGAKSDVGNIGDIFDADNVVLVTDPVYPVYVDTSVMSGKKVISLPTDAAQGFLPVPSEQYAADLIFLCSPANPTGATINRDIMADWIAFARKHGSVIFLDAAYECFITGDEPHSIYELPGAKECAIEFASFSKKAGFTGVRCGYTVVPKQLVRDDTPLRNLWLRRQTTRFNGASYITQRGAEAALTPEGEQAVAENLIYYRENARVITDALDQLGIYYTGGKNSPYVWMECPGGMDSWTFFDRLLEEAAVVGTPGAGFGACGERFFRLTAFSTREDTEEAVRRLQAFVQKL